MNRAETMTGGRGLTGPAAGQSGSSFIEALAAIGIVMLLGAMAVPQLGRQRDYLSASGAARHLACVVHLTRTEAVKRGTHVGLLFQPSGQRFRFALFADGNRDGVRSGDIAGGVDRQVTEWASLDENFPRTAFGIAPGVTDPDSGGPLGGSPLKLGGGSLLSFGPTGGATSGTVYLRGPTEQQYAVRILGVTGRSRVLRFDFRGKRWIPA